MLGTPNEECWPGIRQLPDYKPTFPQWSAQDLTRHVPLLDETGLDLLKVSRGLTSQAHARPAFAAILVLLAFH